MSPQLIDTHTHVNFQAFREDADEVVQRALEEGVWLINVGTQFETSRRAVELADNYFDGVYAAIGLHPMHVFEQDVDEGESSFKTRGEEFDPESYKALALHSTKVVAIGEFGLDYYRLPKDIDPQEVKAKQKQVFEEHVKLASAVGKPLMIHCRPSSGTNDAYEDIIQILNSKFRNLKSQVNFEIHSFTGDRLIAQEFLKLGGFIGLNGIITFDKTGRSEEVVKNVPLDRIILETDAPYLTPVPYRGKRNEPAYVKFIAEKIAGVKGISLEEIQQMTTQNARRLYRI